MKDTYQIGCSPNGEDCAQVGAENYQTQALKECNVYKNQLERVYKNMPYGMRLKVSSNPHDLGSYHEVEVIFDDCREDHETFLWGNLECGCEKWDAEARAELGLDGPTVESKPRQIKISELGVSVEDLMFASVVPAVCSEGCQVEPDGTCQHGFPSVLIEAGLI